jgi:hypothetical protein
MTADRSWEPWWLLPALALALTWPAVWNFYPIVFADTGTYLSQAIHRYAGWDRPVFYSLFMLPLHMTITTWPVVFAQGAITAWVLLLVRRFAPSARGAPALLFLTALTWQPWLVAQLMPDLFTPLVVLGFALIAWGWDRLARWERWALLVLTSFMIATQQSSVALWAGLCVAAWPASRLIGARFGAVRLLAPLVAALLALTGVNLAAHGRLSPSFFGNVFILARLLADGPALHVLRTHCPEAGWRLCAEIDRIATDSDIILWAADSPLLAAGGHKAVAGEAGDIIAKTLREEPGAVLATMARNALSQLVRMASADGFEPWPRQVTPRLRDDFPTREVTAYLAARQQRAEPLPAGLATLHLVVNVAGIGLCLALLPLVWRRAPAQCGLLIVALLALPLSAVITGALSCPHDRYQARLGWVPALVGVLTLAGLPRNRA